MQNFNFQGFRFTGSNFMPAYGCFQFLYKGYEISVSNMGVDKEACPTEVRIFKDNAPVKDFHTVQDALEWVNQN